MSNNCGCENCQCGQGLNIVSFESAENSAKLSANFSAAEEEEIMYESSGFSTYEWKQPVIFPMTDGGINQ